MNAEQRAGDFNMETHLKPIIATELVNQIFDKHHDFDLVKQLTDMDL